MALHVLHGQDDKSDNCRSLSRKASLGMCDKSITSSSIMISLSGDGKEKKKKKRHPCGHLLPILYGIISLQFLLIHFVVFLADSSVYHDSHSIPCCIDNSPTPTQELTQEWCMQFFLSFIFPLPPLHAYAHLRTPYKHVFLITWETVWESYSVFIDIARFATNAGSNENTNQVFIPKP